MEGAFKTPRHSRPPGVPEDTRTATQIYLILRAADGLLLQTTLEYDRPLFFFPMQEDCELNKFLPITDYPLFSCC